MSKPKLNQEDHLRVPENMLHRLSKYERFLLEAPAQHPVDAPVHNAIVAHLLRRIASLSADIN